MSKELTFEKSTEQAEILKRIQSDLQALDIDYLEQAYEGMRSNHSLRESAMILDPNPHTAIERGDLEAAKLRQLKIYLDGAKNLKSIMEAELKLMSASRNSQQLSRLFGM